MVAYFYKHYHAQFSIILSTSTTLLTILLCCCVTFSCASPSLSTPSVHLRLTPSCLFSFASGWLATFTTLCLTIYFCTAAIKESI